MNDSGWRKAAAVAFPKTLPVLAGYVVLGFGFGLLLQSKGYLYDSCAGGVRSLIL